MLFQRFQIREQVVDLVRTELEFRHGRVTGHDAFGKRLTKGLDGIALMERSERRRGMKRALTGPVDRVAPRAMRSGVDPAALFGR